MIDIRYKIGIYSGLYIVLCVLFLPNIVFSSECSCEVDYYEHSSCSSDNINFPFTQTITFDAAQNGQSVWNTLRQYLQQGYPAVCEATSNLIRKAFINEFELRVLLQCRADSSPRNLDSCYVITRYNKNEPVYEIRNTTNGNDLADQSCVKSMNGSVLRGCSTSLPPELNYDERITGMFYIGDHNNCVFNTRDEDTIYNIWYEVSCTMKGNASPPAVNTEPDPTIQNNYVGIPFAIPSTESIRITKARTLPELIGKGLRLFTGFFGSIALIMVIYGGLQIMTAAGQSEKIKQGGKIIAWASIGLITMMLSYLLVSFVFGAIV